MLFKPVKNKDLFTSKASGSSLRQKGKPVNFFRRREEDSFLDYQKEQYKKFLVLRHNYSSQGFRFSKVNHIIFLVFCSFFLGFRFVSSYDWYY
jgi:hypothetical protein